MPTGPPDYFGGDSELYLAAAEEQLGCIVACLLACLLACLPACVRCVQASTQTKRRFSVIMLDDCGSLGVSNLSLCFASLVAMGVRGGKVCGSSLIGAHCHILCSRK